MANKKLDARIPQKHDIEAHWKLATNFIPMAGELIVYDPDEMHDYARFKCGDGVTYVNDLPFFTDNLLDYINAGLNKIGNDFQLYAVIDDQCMFVETLLEAGGMPGYVIYDIVDDIPNSLIISGNGVYYVSIHKKTGISYVDVGYGVMTLGQVFNVINEVEYEWVHGWTTDPSKEKADGFYVVNKNTVVKDIVDFPVRGDIDKIYRLRKNTAKLVFVTEGEIIDYLLLVNTLMRFDFDREDERWTDLVQARYYVVESLPSINEALPALGKDYTLNAYILEDTGIGYLAFGSEWRTAGNAFLELGDHGWTDNISAETGQGKIYTIRDGEATQDSYHLYNGLNWLQLVDSGALANKVDKVDGKQLSTNDFTNKDKATINALVGPYSERLEFTLKDDGTYEVSGRGTHSTSSVVIPPVIDGCRVTSIKDNAFKNWAGLYKISIPDTVTQIGSAAFSSCNNLENITLPSSVKYIFSNAFNNCDSLTSITIPEGVNAINSHTFMGCNNLTSIVISNTITSIGYYAFSSCTALTSITVPASVTNIGSYAFSMCTNLTSIMIPKSVTTIGDHAFLNCSNLTIYCEAESQPEGWDANWNPSNRPVVWGAALDFASVNSQLNELNDKSIDKVALIDTWANDFATEIEDLGYGIVWSENYSFTGNNGEELFTGEITQKIPLSAGNNITFTVDNDNGTVKINSTIDKDIMKFVTYSELKSLRDDQLLIPGMFYRITDYKCTSIQADTRAVMGTQFDIIVQALSESILSETASACAPGGEPVLMDSVLNNKVIKSHVIPYYREYIDFDGPGTDGLDPDYRQGKDVFVAYDYLENNDGEVVPVIFKTDAAGIDPTKANFSSDLTEPDYQDAFYYEGTFDIDGVTYDKWRLIDEDTDSTELKWDSASKAYVYTNQIVNNGTIELESFLYEEETDEYTLDSSAVVASYFEFVDHPDYSDDQYSLRTLDDKKFAAYEYLPNNRGKIVPVLHDWCTDGGVIGYNENYYYEGRATIEGEVYDKWRKIELDSEDFGWDSPGKAYYYTNIIVESGAPISSNIKFHAWELKYCLDNDTMRFAWAADKITCVYTMQAPPNSDKKIKLYRNSYFDNTSGDDTVIYAWVSEDETKIAYTDEDLDSIEDSSAISWFKDGQIIEYRQIGELFEEEKSFGKGVIYYMKDEFNNECPYDFKNIQFKRMVSLENGYPELDEENGEETWVYTFCCNGESTTLVDGSTEIYYGKQNDDTFDLFHDNIIGTYFQESINGKTAPLMLNNNVFLGLVEYYSDRTAAWCSNNNTLKANCYGNTFNYHCKNNVFGGNCRSNIFGNNCYYNTLGNYCDSNTFGNNCNSNTFGDNCYSNVFSNGCYFNTFDNECSYIVINGDNIQHIEVGSGVKGSYNNLLQITPEQNVDYQQIYRKSGSKEILI